MSNGKYYLNMCVMAVMWTSVDFTTTCFSFMNKYIEGSIFVNFYFEGAAGIIGTLVAQPLFSWLKIRYTFVVAYSISLLFLTLLLLFQQEYVPATWLKSLGANPPNEESENEYCLKILIPIIVFIIKLAVNITALNVYQCSFSSDAIFPFYKRATSIGIVNFVSRCFTIAAPIVAECSRPIPVIVLLSLNTIALISSFFLPSK